MRTVKQCDGQYELRHSERWTNGRVMNLFRCVKCAAEVRGYPHDGIAPLVATHGAQRASGLWNTEWIYNDENGDAK